MISLIFTLFGLPLFAQKVITTNHVTVSIISPQTTVGEDRKLALGLQFKIDPEWHIYWKNPGDSGAAPKFAVTDGELLGIQWPYPKRIPVKGLTNFGYEKEVVFLIDVLIGNQTTSIQMNLEWLVCKIECIPGYADFTYRISRTATMLMKDELNPERVTYQKALLKIPGKETNWRLRVSSYDQKTVKLKLKPRGPAHISQIKELFIFPENGAAFLPQNPKIETGDDHVEISIPVSLNEKPKFFENFTAVIRKNDNSIVTFEKSLEIKEKPTNLGLGLVLAFIGGIILNLMPCVFPVLSLKIFGFLKDPNPNKIKKSAWAYTAGVIVTFTAIGIALTILRYSGEAIGWGYQLQNPWLVYLLAFLFFAMALNFFGFFEMGNSIMGWAGQFGQNGILSGDFGTGVLAVIVASPCTAPFMGSALGLTLLLPAYLSTLIFVSLGFGMALPMLLLSYWPQFISRLPKSGSWMVTLKQVMSFPLVLTSLWLLWVLSHQKGEEAIVLSIVSFSLFAVIMWLLKISKKNGAKSLLILLLVTLILGSSLAISKLSPHQANSKGHSLWQTYSKDLVEKAMKNQAVFIDFTASWCITCQINKKTVLETEKIQNLFEKHNVLLVRADWTNKNPEVTQALASYGRNSLPLYVIYNRKNQADILPEILTQDMIIQYFEDAYPKGDTLKKERL